MRVPLRLPLAVGVHTTATLQDAPGASDDEVEQVVEPALKVKLVPTEIPEKVSGALPMFWSVTVCALLVPFRAVAGNIKEGICERCSSKTRLLPLSAMKTSPKESTATPAGFFRPVPMEVWHEVLVQPAGISST